MEFLEFKFPSWSDGSKANLRVLIAATGLAILPISYSNCRIFGSICPWNLRDDLKNNREHRPCTSSYVCHSIAIRKLEFELPSDSAQFRAKSTVFHPVETWNLTDDLAKPHDTSSTSSMLVQVCASLHSHWWIQTGFTVSKRRILGKTYEIFSRMTLKIDIWNCKTIGHLRHWSYGPEKPKLGHFLPLWHFETWNSHFKSVSLLDF